MAGLFDRYCAVDTDAAGALTALPANGVLKCHENPPTAPPACGVLTAGTVADAAPLGPACAADSVGEVTITGLNVQRPPVVPGLAGAGTPCCSTVVGPLNVSGVPVAGNCALGVPIGPRLTTCRPLVDGGVWIDGLVMPLVIEAPDSATAVPSMLPLLTMAPPARMARLPPRTYEFSTPMVGAFSALALVPLDRLPPKTRWQPEMSPPASQPQRSLTLAFWSEKLQW
ncbi:hypothetical protein LMG9673_04610 [Ralstonia pseudosolanacearum]|nr:hypothetical protein LMG9673_04610 [Ralstonia pseudosolanacearum]